MAATFSRKTLEAVDLSSAAVTSYGPEVTSDRVRAQATVLQDNIKLLKLLLVELQQDLEALVWDPTPNVEKGIDFYDAVSRFEIELIRQALKLTKGHQSKAARILNLNATTLGAKIKHYQIQLGHPAFFR